MEIDAKSPSGNAFVIMGHVQRLLEDADRGDEVETVMDRMKSRDYDYLCKVAEEVTYGSIKVVNRN